MKSKALTYIMLVVVGIIWYQVFFRVKGNLTGEDAEVPKPNESLATIRAISRDTVALKVDYRDPFHYKKTARSVSMNNDANQPPVARVANKRPIVRKPQFAWPVLTYHGLVRNRKSDKPLALIHSDGLIYNLRPGDEIFNSVYVKSVAPDSLVINHKKLRKTIYRN